MKISKNYLKQIIQEEVGKLLGEDKAQDPEVIQVQNYLTRINDRSEFIEIMGVLLRKLMNYSEVNVSAGEFRAELVNIFGNDDGPKIYTVLQSSDMEGEDPQDEKDKDDERLAAKDPEASRREDDGDEYGQTLADRRREQAGAEK